MLRPVFLFISFIYLTSSVYAGETKSSRNSKDSHHLKAGDCILSVKNIYERINTDGTTSVIPLASAKEDDGCKKLRNYTAVEIAYSKDKRTGTTFKQTTVRDLKEGFSDPSGLTWGSTVSLENGEARAMDQNQAHRYCQSIGARLPTKEEFEQLAKYLGRGTAKGYNPYLDDGKTDVLPELSKYMWWSSSPYPNRDGVGFAFNGNKSNLNPTNSYTPLAVRCVVG